MDTTNLREADQPHNSPRNVRWQFQAGKIAGWISIDGVIYTTEIHVGRQTCRLNVAFFWAMLYTGPAAGKLAGATQLASSNHGVLAMSGFPEVVGPERLAIGDLGGEEVHVTATYVGTGLRRSGRHLYPTVLVTEVRAADGRLLSDHLWFNRGEVWRKAGLTRGDRIAFDARGIEYRTGYWGPSRIRRVECPPRVEFKLTPPKRIAIVRRTRQRRIAA